MKKSHALKIKTKKVLPFIFLFFILATTIIAPLKYYIKTDHSQKNSYVYLTNSYSNWGMNVEYTINGITYKTITNYNGCIKLDSINKIDNLKIYSRKNELLYEESSVTVPFNIAIPHKVNGISFFLSFIGTIFSIFIIFLAISIYKADPNRRLSRPFLILSLTPLTFYFTTMLQNILAAGGNEVLAGTIFAFHRLGFMFYPAAFYELCYSFAYPKKMDASKLAICYGIPILLTPTLLSWIIAGSDFYFTRMWNFSFNQFLQTFNAYTMITLIMSTYLLTKAVNDKTNPLYLKARSMIFGVLTAITILITLFILPQLFLTNEPFMGYYDLVVLVVTFMFYTSLSYAVIKSHIVNIHSILNHTMINLLISAITVVIYVFIQEMYMLYIKPEDMIMHSALILFMLSLVLEPLRNKVKNISENIFFPEKTILKPALNFYNEHIATNLIKNNIVEKTQELYTDILNIKKTDILFKQDNFFIFNKKQIEIQKCNCNTKFIHKHDIDDNCPVAQKIFELTNATILIPLSCNKDIIGILALSEKKSGKPLTTQEISICVTIAANIALSLFNAEQNEKILRSQKLLAHTEKLSAVGKLSASIAHEIKNPLAAIMPLMSLLPEMNSDSQFIKDFMDIVPRQLDKINTKIITLLSFSKKDNTPAQPLYIEPIMDDVISLLNVNLKKNSIEIKKVYDSIYTDKKINFSKDELYSVLTNLLINAIDAIETKKGQITIQTINSEESKTLIITDTGKGIEDKYMNKIFDPFFSTKESGTGLGLSTVSQIINSYNGQISVSSKVGKGTSFYIILPTT